MQNACKTKLSEAHIIVAKNPCGKDSSARTVEVKRTDIEVGEKVRPQKLF